MSQTLVSRPSNEPDPPRHEETSTGLEDPRTIHPSPDEVIPESDSFPVPDSSLNTKPTRREANNESGDIDRGMVDPRQETMGPDI